MGFLVLIVLLIIVAVIVKRKKSRSGIGQKDNEKEIKSDINQQVYVTKKTFYRFVAASVAALVLLGAAIVFARPVLTALLSSAVISDKPTRVEFFLNAGADANVKVKGDYGNEYTALAYAVKEGSSECVRLLLDAGADVNAKYGYGYTALADAARSGSTDCVRLWNTASSR